MKFYCQGCQKVQDTFEELIADACTTTKFFVDDLGEMHYSEQTTEHGYIERYQCATCGWNICYSTGEPIRDEDDFLDWLEVNKTLVATEDEDIFE